MNDVGKDSNGKSFAEIVAKEIKNAGSEAVAKTDSVAAMAGEENIVKTANRNFGRIDILVNCDGSSRNAPSAVCGKWTADELSQIIPPLLEISRTDVSGG